jgi:hypothetical protein
MLGLSVFTGAALASNIGTAHALQIPKTVGTGWWNVNHTPARPDAAGRTRTSTMAETAPSMR